MEEILSRAGKLGTVDGYAFLTVQKKKKAASVN